VLKTKSLIFLVCIYMSLGKRGGLIVSALVSGWSGTGSSPGREQCCVIGRDTWLLPSLSPPRCINGYRRVMLIVTLQAEDGDGMWVTSWFDLIGHLASMQTLPLYPLESWLDMAEFCFLPVCGLRTVEVHKLAKKDGNTAHRYRINSLNKDLLYTDNEQFSL